MSSYWKGYYGVACVMKEEEYFGFLEKYAEKNGKDLDELEAEIDNEGLACYSFIKSSCHDTKGSTLEPDVPFEITEILTDDCDGMSLIPYRTRRKSDNAVIPNQYFLGISGDKPIVNTDFRTRSLRANNCYVIFADRDMDGCKAFERKVYDSYEDLVQEFKDKLETYLPEDFDWDFHIGRFSYAAYA